MLLVLLSKSLQRTYLLRTRLMITVLAVRPHMSARACCCSHAVSYQRLRAVVCVSARLPLPLRLSLQVSVEGSEVEVPAGSRLQFEVDLVDFTNVSQSRAM